MTIQPNDPMYATYSMLLAKAKAQFPTALPDWLNTLITAIIDAAVAWLASCGITVTAASINSACKSRTFAIYYAALRQMRTAYADSFGPGKFYANKGEQAVELMLACGETATPAQCQPVIDLANSGQ